MIADGVWQLAGFSPNILNVYLVGDVLIDAATRWDVPRILRQLRSRTLRLVVLTHCHPDHQGAARAVCERFGVPLACHEADVPAAEGRVPMLPNNWLVRLGVKLLAGPSCPVGRILREGDEVAGFRVVHAPGHTPGHIILFRDSDRLALAGDLMANTDFVTGRTGLREPPTFFSADPALNRRSIRTLAELAPAVVCFGHGPPLRNRRVLERFATQLIIEDGQDQHARPARFQPSDC
jgi:glyoxylase-like metal-dependent hydrolase (beta-lactamase superfamily II)